MRNRLDSRSLAAFVAVAESLSFRQAAEVLHVSQPPLSRTIKELELRLGVSLFDRDKRGVKLTAAGDFLLPRARRILRLMQDAEAQLLALPGRNEIRLGLTNAVEYGKLTQTLVRGAKKRGTVISTVSDSSPRLVRELRANRIDAAYIALPTESAGLHVIPVERQPMVVAIATANPLARSKRLSLAKLNGEPVFWFERARQPAFFDHCRKVFARHRFSPRWVREPIDHQVLLAEVAAGKAIALLPRSFVLLKRPGVAYRPLREGLELAVTIGLATRGDRPDVRKALQADPRVG